MNVHDEHRIYGLPPKVAANWLNTSDSQLRRWRFTLQPKRKALLSISDILAFGVIKELIYTHEQSLDKLKAYDLTNLFDGCESTSFDNLLTTSVVVDLNKKSIALQSSVCTSSLKKSDKLIKIKLEGIGVKLASIFFRIGMSPSSPFSDIELFK